MITLRSYAKINLGLEILNKRLDGYHNLRTIFQTIDWFDSIHIEANTLSKIRLTGNHPSIEWGETNLIYKAFQSFFKEFKQQQGFNVSVEKQIPPGSGLGGGSSNAAVILIFLKNYFGLTIEQYDLITLAAELGADVPFFLLGGTVLGEGKGEHLTQLNDIQQFNLGVCCPQIIVSTKDIFNQNLTKSQNQSKIKFFLEDNKVLLLENELEKVTFRLYPELERIKEEMKKSNVLFVSMSGSGSALYCIAESDELNKMKHTLPNFYVTRSLDQSTYKKNIGASPSGKAPVFGAGTRRFESFRPRGYSHE